MDINRLIVSVPIDKLIISEHGRLDYPENLPCCPGIKADRLGGIKKECVCCLNFLTHYRTSKNWTPIDESFIGCTKTSETIIVDYDFIDCFSCSVDSVAFQKYINYVLPVLEKLYERII